jgi:hypothetical protein
VDKAIELDLVLLTCLHMIAIYNQIMDFNSESHHIFLFLKPSCKFVAK